MQQTANVQFFKVWPSNISHCTALVRLPPCKRTECRTPGCHHAGISGGSAWEPPTSSDGAGPVAPDSDQQPLEQLEEMLEEEVSSTMEPPPCAISTETVGETEYPPVLLARRATAMLIKSQSAPPTAATKCPRPKFHLHEEVTRRRKSKPKPVFCPTRHKKVPDWGKADLPLVALCQDSAWVTLQPGALQNYQGGHRSPEDCWWGLPPRVFGRG